MSGDNLHPNIILSTRDAAAPKKLCQMRFWREGGLLEIMAIGKRFVSPVPCSLVYEQVRWAGRE